MQDLLRYNLDQLLTASVPADGNKFDAIELQENNPEQQQEAIVDGGSSEGNGYNTSSA